MKISHSHLELITGAKELGAKTYEEYKIKSSGKVSGSCAIDNLNNGKDFVFVMAFYDEDQNKYNTVLKASLTNDSLLKINGLKFQNREIDLLNESLVKTIVEINIFNQVRHLSLGNGYPHIYELPLIERLKDKLSNTFNKVVSKFKKPSKEIKTLSRAQRMDKYRRRY